MVDTLVSLARLYPVPYLHMLPWWRNLSVMLAICTVFALAPRTRNIVYPKHLCAYSLVRLQRTLCALAPNICCSCTTASFLMGKLAKACCDQYSCTHCCSWEFMRLMIDENSGQCNCLQCAHLRQGSQGASYQCWMSAVQASWMSCSPGHCRPGQQNLRHMAACVCHDEAHTLPENHESSLR